MELYLEGKTAIVTGGAGGLGAAVAEALAAEGAGVTIHYHSKREGALTLAERLNRRYGADCIAIGGDAANPADADAVFEGTLAHFGKADILINNAAVWPTSYVEDMSDAEWEKTLQVNLNGPFYFCSRMVRHLKARGSGGKIINIVSQAAFHGSTTGHAHYAAAKGGLVTFTVSLAREAAKYGINVNAVAPGMMRTPMNADALAEREAEYLKRIPLGRIADPAEVADTVVFLASKRADYITGATIDVTGGMLMR